MELTETFVFVLAACAIATVTQHPSSPVAAAIESPGLRRAIQGAAMGATLIAIIYSRLGARSGAHMNPSLTFTYWRLGRLTGTDATAYITAQFIGAAAGFLLAGVVIGGYLRHDAIHFLTTVPGPSGAAVAWVAELVIAFVLMFVVLFVNNHPRLTPYTGIVAGAMITLFVALEAPISGMSLNPARSLGAALAARDAEALWIYFTAPPLGMVLASFAYVALVPGSRVYCAKINHFNGQRCIFRCHFPELLTIREKK